MTTRVSSMAISTALYTVLLQGVVTDDDVDVQVAGAAEPDDSKERVVRVPVRGVNLAVP